MYTYIYIYIDPYIYLPYTQQTRENKFLHYSSNFAVVGPPTGEFQLAAYTARLPIYNCIQTDTIYLANNINLIANYTVFSTGVGFRCTMGI